MGKGQLLVMPLDMGYTAARIILHVLVKAPTANLTGCLVFAVVKIPQPPVPIVKCHSPVNKIFAAMLPAKLILMPSVS